MKLEKLKLRNKVLSKENMNCTYGGRMSTVTGTQCSATGADSTSGDCCSDIQGDASC